MQLFRSKYTRNIFSFLTGMIFLNMSFFLAEVSALKIEKNKKLLENICKLIAGSSSEEEKDVFGGSADEDFSLNEIDLIFVYNISDLPTSNHSNCAHSILTLGMPLFGNYEIYSPPPEV